MPSITTSKLSLYTANELFNLDSSGNLYLFIGKPYPWADDLVPETPVDNDIEHYKIWDNIIGFKQILNSDARIVVPRVDWVIGTVYSQYDNIDANLNQKQFYVLNRNYEVFKCISNNNDDYSIVEPEGTNLEIFTTSDGYKWKYLYTISSSDQARFLTRNWMPISENSLVSEAALSGKIDTLKIITKGSGYYQSNTTITVQGNGSNLAITPVILDNKLEDYEITNGGNNYSYVNLTVTGAGTGANIRAIISPPGGHGKNNVRELKAKHLMFSTVLNYEATNTNLPANISYRSVGLIFDLKSNTGSRLNSYTSGANKIIKINPDYGADFSQNQYITGNISNANAFVFYTQINTGNTDLRIIQASELTSNFNNFSVGEVVTASNTGSQGTVISISEEPVQKYSGDIIYIDNRAPITRSLEQTESIHIVIGF